MQNEARQRLLQLQQGLQTEVSSSELMEGDRGGERGKSTGQQQLLVLHADPRWLAGNRSWKSFITGKSSKPSKDGLKKNPEASNDSSQNHSQARKGIRGQLRHKTPLRTWICSDATVPPRQTQRFSRSLQHIERERERKTHTHS